MYQVDSTVIKQTTLALKHLAKKIRGGEDDNDTVLAYSRLLSEYNSIVKTALTENEGMEDGDEMLTMADREWPAKKFR